MGAITHEFMMDSSFERGFRGRGEHRLIFLAGVLVMGYCFVIVFHDDIVSKRPELVAGIACR
jgi:hypothetical protein